MLYHRLNTAQSTEVLKLPSPLKKVIRFERTYMSSMDVWMLLSESAIGLRDIISLYPRSDHGFWECIFSWKSAVESSDPRRSITVHNQRRRSRRCPLIGILFPAAQAIGFHRHIMTFTSRRRKLDGVRSTSRREAVVYVGRRPPQAGPGVPGHECSAISARSAGVGRGEAVPRPARARWVGVMDTRLGRGQTNVIRHRTQTI